MTKKEILENWLEAAYEYTGLEGLEPYGKKIVIAPDAATTSVLSFALESFDKLNILHKHLPRDLRDFALACVTMAGTAEAGAILTQRSEANRRFVAEMSLLRVENRGHFPDVLSRAVTLLADMCGAELLIDAETAVRLEDDVHQRILSRRSYSRRKLSELRHP